MRVMGYFCVAANTRWAKEHPDLSYGFPSDYHLPLSDAYLDYLGAAVEDAVRRTDMDGFMVDWLWNPTDKVRAAQNKGRWIDCDKQLFETLVGKPFPANGRPAAADRQVYERKAIERCWRRIHDAAKRVKPDCVIWISCNNVLDPACGHGRAEGGRLVHGRERQPGADAENRRALGAANATTALPGGLGRWAQRAENPRRPSQRRLRDLWLHGPPGPTRFRFPSPDASVNLRIAFSGNERNVAVLARFFTGRPFDYVTPPPAAPK